MKNEIIFVSGQRGSGKTTWIKSHLRDLNRYLLYDTLGEYEAPTRFLDIESLLEYCKAKREGFFEVVFDPPNDEDFPVFCRIALAVRRIYVVIEEMDLFSKPSETPIELQRLIKYGRHYEINIIGVSRRPAEVSRLFTSQATRFILFKQIEPRDIAYFRSIIGPQAEILPGFDLYDFLDIDFSKTPSSALQPQRLPAP
ncbi:MAG: hypothetical protein HWN68_18330 [Desulfobacterales bacterium]|nr:hypothetical protein [Desulfobacterales bacterium]